MRLLIVPLCLFAAGSARVCDSEEKGGASAVASADVQAAIAGGADVKAALRAPRIGGTVAAAGDYSVEVALHEGGRIEALLSDLKGALVSSGAKLSALVQAKGGASEKVELAFVPARGRFEGKAKAGVELAPGPVDVSLDVNGKAHGCKLKAGVVTPRPKLGGHVLAAGDFSAELFARAGGEVQAFVHDSAGAEVKADAGASFKARCRAKGGATEEIALSFDAPRACFAGKAKAGVELEPGPIELVVDAKAGAGIGGLESIALEVDASHGGQLVAAGDFTVELVAKGSEVSAFVFDASGKAHAAGDLDLKLDVGADLGADAASKLALKWDAPSLSYKASFSGKGDISLQPIRVALVAAGKAHFGAVASLQAAAKANLDAKAKLDANVGANLDAKAKLDPKLDAKAKLDASAKLDPKLDAKAKASLEKGASAAVKVTPPKVDAKAGANAGAKAGGNAKASAGFSFGTK